MKIRFNKLSIGQKKALWAYIFLFVPLIFYIVIRIYPAFSAFYISFTDWDIVSSEKQFFSLEKSGIKAVSLGNNHAFDCFEEGFYKVVSALNKMKIPWCGAGLNIKEASKPLIMKVSGITIGFLCMVDKSSGPSHFADESEMGVVPLELEKNCQTIKALKENVSAPYKKLNIYLWYDKKTESFVWSTSTIITY